MGKIYDTINKYLTDHQYTIVFSDDEIFHLAFRGETTNLNLVIHCSEENNSFRVRYSLPWQAPVNKMIDVSFWIANMNRDDRLGAYALDSTDGEIIYHVIVPLVNGEINETIVATYIDTMYALINEDFPKLMRFLYEDKSELSTKTYRS